MKDILDVMRKSISQHYRGNKMIGTIAIKSVKEFFQLEKKWSKGNPARNCEDEDIVREQEVIEGYVRNGKLFIKTEDQALKIEIFKKKKELIALINNQLSNLWYKQTIDDIFLK